MGFSSETIGMIFAGQDHLSPVLGKISSSLVKTNYQAANVQMTMDRVSGSTDRANRSFNSYLATTAKYAATATIFGVAGRVIFKSLKESTTAEIDFKGTMNNIVASAGMFNNPQGAGRIRTEIDRLTKSM